MAITTEHGRKELALSHVRAAAASAAMIRPTGPDREYDVSRLREAQAELALAQIAAEQAGATGTEIDDASEWEGIEL